MFINNAANLYFERRISVQRGNKILGIGILIFSVVMLIDNLIIMPEMIIIFFEGIGAGLELIGVILLFKDKKDK